MGSALRRGLTDRNVSLFVPRETFQWNDISKLQSQISASVAEFAYCSEAAGNWRIFWAAGVGAFSSLPSQMASETCALRMLLHELALRPGTAARQGVLVFAGSAGAVYAGSMDEVMTEDTLPAPTTAYGHEKIAQEQMLRSFTIRQPKVRCTIARISTLYGVQPEAGKRQGLLSHMARCIVRNIPVHVYVPLDTIRDYVHADDAAHAMISASLAGHPARIVVKIVASEQPATIAEIVSIFKRVSRRFPRIITSARQESSLYSRRIQFRSLTSRRDDGHRDKGLLVGISELMAAERASYAVAIMPNARVTAMVNAGDRPSK